MKDKSYIPAALLEKVKTIAHISEGYSSITDLNGRRIKTYNSNGEEVPRLDGQVFELARLAGETGCLQVGKSAIIEDAESWAVPMGEYIIAASNVEKCERDKNLRKALMDALPYIAQTAGGEAVVFDRDGRRLRTVDASGKILSERQGVVSQAAHMAMLSQKPIIGNSNTVTFATAVRIPLTNTFGLGFNNEVHARKEKKLVEEVKKVKTANYDLHDIVGESDRMRQLKELCTYISGSGSSVLLFGETGTGKELFAQAIHNNSIRSGKPFIAINCAAIPENIVESYLFGYVGGAYTGAKREGSPGAFEQADGGTIFLDEISEMNYDLQTKLLRVLQEREVMRVGSFKPKKVDVRVISSTNRNIFELIGEGKMRSDLYYRLNVIELVIPPLRERRQDIPLLTDHFLKKFNALMGRFIFNIDEKALSILTEYDWPGNVRELQNCLERAVNMIEPNENILKLRHLPSYLLKKGEQDFNAAGCGGSLKELLADAERRIILDALRQTDFSRHEAANILGISAVTLWRKMKELKISL